MYRTRTRATRTAAVLREIDVGDRSVRFIVVRWLDCTRRRLSRRRRRGRYREGWRIHDCVVKFVHGIPRHVLH